MQLKLKKLLKEINLNDEFIHTFENASIEKVIIYDRNKILNFVLNNNVLIPIDIYKHLLNSLKEYFSNVELIKLTIIPIEVDYSKITEYYNYIMKNICHEQNRYQIFLEREIEIDDNILKIKAYNKIECTNLISLKEELVNKLKDFGFNVSIDIDLVLEGDKELIDRIEKEKEILAPTTSQTETKPLKKEPEETKKPTYRAKKTTEVTAIKDVLYEVENICIEATIFGIEYFESKSGYKIITIKVTDYSDSMYVKMFTKDDDEYGLIKKLLKEGKWYHFYGKATMDKYARIVMLSA